MTRPSAIGFREPAPSPVLEITLPPFRPLHAANTNVGQPVVRSSPEFPYPSPAPRHGRFAQPRERTIEALVYVLENDVPWTSQPVDCGKPNSNYQNCRRWMSTGTLDRLLIRLVEMGRTENWPIESSRYGREVFDPVGCRHPGVIHIAALKQAHIYRCELVRGVPLRQDNPLQRIFYHWSI